LRWRRIALVAAVLLAVGVAAAAAAGIGLGSQKAESASQRPAAVATVTRQTLLDEETMDGELGYGGTSTLVGRVNGTVTALPAAGATIRRGQSLYRVDDTPVVLCYGSLPAYRALSVGMVGRDVAQLEKNLAALGYSGFTVDDTYTASTAAAVRNWQDDLGLPETGNVELGRVRFAPAPVRVDTLKLAVGDPAGAAIYTYSGVASVVTVELDVADRRLATVGAAVTITGPDGRTVAGKIATVRTVIEEGTGQDDQASTTIEVTVRVSDQKAVSGFDQAAVRVAFTASRREDVLTVPVAALLALAEGGYGLEVVDGATTRLIAVRTGLFASGRVEVSGSGLTEGMTVGVPA
jgi:membrane fusion protein, multidrug efflux system